VKDEFGDLVLQMYKGGILYPEAVHAFKKAFITIALRENEGNLSRLAPKLGLHRNTLARTVAQLEVDVEALRPARRPPGKASSAYSKKKMSR
jgi:Fis family transcriptional regulator, factor for inversion stimulation protein